MHLETMALHASITTSVYSELTTAIQMLFVLIMVADFIAIANRGFQNVAYAFGRVVEILNRGDTKTLTHRQVELVDPRLAQNVSKITNVKMEVILVQTILIVLIQMPATIATAMMVTTMAIIFVIISTRFVTEL